MIPSDTGLYKRVKGEADAKFLAPTSIYKSAWIVGTYKKRGGTFDDKADPNRGLTRWFKEKWVDLNRGSNAPCGRPKATLKGSYPLCRPSVRVTPQTPKLPAELGAKSIKKAKAEKQKVKHASHIRFETKR
jgi:hypothetical protein